jgi:RNA polymerase sigma factor (sigma-70 family)
MATSEEVEHCVRSDFRRIVGIVTVACGSPSLAEDAVQMAFVKAFERAERGRTIDNLPGWVVRVAINETRSRWRRAAAERRAVGRMNGLATRESGPDHDELVDLGDAVRHLPMRQQQAVVLHYLLGLDVTETAGVLGVGPGTVKKALSRAREHLGRALEER